MAVPQSTIALDGACGPASTQSPSELGPLSGEDDGAAYVEILEAHDRWTPRCERGRRVAGSGSLLISRTLTLLRVTTSSAEPVSRLWHVDAEGSGGAVRLQSLEDVAPGPTARTREGDVIAFWTHVDVHAPDLAGQLHVSLVTEHAVLNDLSRVPRFKGRRRT
jgi:hypothetical protein